MSLKKPKNRTRPCSKRYLAGLSIFGLFFFSFFIEAVFVLDLYIAGLAISNTAPDAYFLLVRWHRMQSKFDNKKSKNPENFRQELTRPKMNDA